MEESYYVPTEDEVIARISKYKSLPMFKKKSENDLKELAIKKLIEEHDNPTTLKTTKVDTLGIDDLFTDLEEKKIADQRIKKYLSEYELESPAERMILKQLVNLEVIQARIQKELNSAQSKSSVVSEKILRTLHANLDQIIALTEKLGINKSKDDTVKTDAYKALEAIQKKFAKWRENNQLSRTRVCPHCGKHILWKMRMEHWDQLKHPFIKDRILVNYKLLELLSKGTITVKDYSEVIGTSEDYVYWMINKLSNTDKEKYNLNSIKKEVVIEDSEAEIEIQEAEITKVLEPTIEK